MTMPDMLRVYEDALRAYGLLTAESSSLTHLQEAFSAMARTLRARGASSFEQEFFCECIALAVACAPAGEMDDKQRADVVSTVHIAFDGLPRRTTVRATPVSFLRAVTFRDERDSALQQEQAS